MSLRTPAASLAVLTAAAASAQPLVGASFRNPSFFGNTALFDIDPMTGAASNMREVQADVSLGLAFHEGTLFSFTDSFGLINGEATGGSLYTIDIATGATSVVGTSLGIETFSEGDLAFDPVSGDLFLTASSQGTSGLFTVDTTTGVASFIAPTEAADASAIAFTEDGRLFVLDTTFEFPTTNAVLREVNAATGATISAVTTDLALGNVAGMVFDPVSGELLVADGDNDGTNQLYTLDVLTGELTVRGTTVPGSGPVGLGGLAGLTFIPAPGAALALGGVALVAVRRRRSV